MYVGWKLCGSVCASPERRKFCGTAISGLTIIERKAITKFGERCEAPFEVVVPGCGQLSAQHKRAALIMGESPCA